MWGFYFSDKPALISSAIFFLFFYTFCDVLLVLSFCVVFYQNVRDFPIDMSLENEAVTTTFFRISS